MVHRRGEKGGADRVYEREGLHGDQALRLRDLGADPEAAGRAVQGNGCGKCLYLMSASETYSFRYLYLSVTGLSLYFYSWPSYVLNYRRQFHPRSQIPLPCQNQK